MPSTKGITPPVHPPAIERPRHMSRGTEKLIGLRP
jgi:hypothetical protein